MIDEYFLALIWKFLRAGYMEQWQCRKTYSGTPQGSGVGPILANIYLDKLDCFMAQYKVNFDIGSSKNHAAKRPGEAKVLRCSSGEMREKGLLSRRTAKMILQTLRITAPRAVILAFDLHFSE